MLSWYVSSEEARKFVRKHGKIRDFLRKNRIRKVKYDTERSGKSVLFKFDGDRVDVKRAIRLLKKNGLKLWVGLTQHSMPFHKLGRQSNSV